MKRARLFFLALQLVAAPLAAQDEAAAPAEGEAPASAEGEAPPSGEGDQAPAQEAPQTARTEVPWADTQDVPLPAFLDTTDRRIEDDRPPPTAAQVAALEEMESEVERFAKVAAGYQGTVRSLLKREYVRKRRSRDQWYSRQVREEEKLLSEARERAIRLFERFIRRYPDDPTYTPDAMFRLGELYFERSSIVFQDSYQAAIDRGDQANAPLTPDFTPTIEIYKRLVRQFSDYERLDGVYYLIGYCLNEMNQPKAARLAWLNLVCSNKFTYDPDAIPTAPEGEGEGEEEDSLADEHPSLTMDGEEEGVPPADGGFVDPYADCKVLVESARFLSETWFRIGEYHFDDYTDPNALDLAIAAYKRILEDPEDRNYNLALYKVAWAYYRASRYPEAIEHFSLLVDWSDKQQAETGSAGSELRPEAIQYLGIAFAYDDWNENQTPDPEEGMPRPIERVQDPALLPQDRPWTPEVYFQLGQVLFDEAKYPEAIEIWRLALGRWPDNHRAPEITNMIARAHQEHKQFEEAIAARAELGNYTEGGEWWDANRDRPAEQRQAERLAENALIGTAIHYHQEAQRLRRRAVAEEDPTLLDRAIENYKLAANAYQKYLDAYPNNPQAYELQYNLADANYWSENYEEAARQYAAVRDSNLDDTHLVEAARRVVESLQRILDKAVAEGTVAVREDPPAVAGSPPRIKAVEMPELLQRLAQGREIYIARVSDAEDTENVREAYDFNNALLLYMYGYWTHARERFQRIFNERCKGRFADETGKVAWQNLNNMAVAMNDTEAVAALSAAIREKKCTFRAGVDAVDVDCSKPENRDEPTCVADVQLTNIRFKRAVDTYAQAEKATGDAQRGLYERAAAMLVQAVNDEPNHPEAPLALEKAATALEKTSRFESAARLYQRIIDEVGPKKAADAEEQEKLDAILANAHFRLAYNANRFFDFDRAVENYRLLADSRRFERSSDNKIQEWRQDSLINAAIILENLQQYNRASEYYRRAVGIIKDPELKRTAYYRMAEVAYKERSYSEAIRLMRDFISRYRGDKAAGELWVQAHWRIAQIRDKLGQKRDYESALRDVTRAFGQSGQAPGSIAAEYAGNAAFILSNTDDVRRFESFKVDPGRPATMEAYVNAIKREINGGKDTAIRLAGEFNNVPEYRRPTWTIAAFVRQGRVYEVLARAVLNTPFVMPADMQKQLRRVSGADRDDIRLQVEDRVREVLDAQVRPIECLAVARYALAARAAKVGSLDNEFTRSAIDRLQAYGDERIAECIEQVRKDDASFAPYQPGEFTRAPRGQNRQPPADVAPPPLRGGR